MSILSIPIGRSSIVVLLLLIAPNSFAAKSEQLSMVALEFEGVVQDNKQGGFDYILQEIAKRSQIPHFYDVYSPARGLRLFFHKRALCMFPSSKSYPYFKGINVIHSQTITTAQYVALTPSDQPKIHTKAELAGKVIGVVFDDRVWRTDQRLAIPDAKYIKLSSVKSLLTMLAIHRIDAAIYDKNVIERLLSAKNIDQVHFDKTLILAKDQIGITCHNTPLARHYISAINPEIDYLVAHGVEQYFIKANF